MACSLERKDGIFVGKAGARVEIGIESETEAGVVSVFYAGDTDGTEPFEFSIAKGRHKLLLVALGGKDDQLLRVVERDGNASCHLKNFFWSRRNFHTTLDIEGVD